MDLTTKEFLLILDHSGFSALTDVHGGKTAAKVIHRLTEIVDAILPQDVKLEERIGDELIISSGKGESLLSTCLKIKTKLAGEHNYPSCHAALHYGEIFREAGGIFSTTLNLTSRMTSYASSGQIICSKSFLEKVVLPDNLLVNSLGELKFKNILNTVEVFEIIDKQDDSNIKLVDPVCKMTFYAKFDTPKLEYKGEYYYFCSNRCLRFFEMHPVKFVKEDKK